ncbi:MAG TPA: ADOP family duplicated permease [Vicinamibacterales bacterium]|nr:ADOP family duplicated permease [Vicinamibacterales bacterium]
MSARPPRLARVLLGRFLPPDERECVIGDLEESFAAQIAAGLDTPTARRRYWQETFDSIRTLRRRSRYVTPMPVRTGDPIMKTMLRDIRQGFRLLLIKPAFTAVAVVTLALGIGANTAIFTVTNALLLKPLPYSDPDQLVLINENNLSRGWTSFSTAPPNFVDWRSQNTSFASMAAYGSRSFNYSGAGTPERLRALAGTEGFLEMLDGVPALGRGFGSDDFQAGKDHVVILNHGFWQRAFGGRDDVVNQTISLNGEPYTIVGVMHDRWRFGGRDISVFTPRVFTPEELGRRGSHFLSVIGRLKPGVQVETARTELTSIASRLEAAYPNTNKGWGTGVTPLLEASVGGIRPMLGLLLGAVALVLLVACANLANMHLARATGRAREMAIRAALGAGRGRIVQQLMTESLILSVVGGAFGLLVAYWATSAFVAAYPTLLPRASDVHVDRSVLLFTGGLSVLTAVLFGLVPALSASRTSFNNTLKEGARGGSSPMRRMMRHALVVAEVALALVLLAGAGLLLKSFLKLGHVDPGFQTDRRLIAQTVLPRPKYAEDARMVDFFNRSTEAIRSIPTVEAVTTVSVVPISGSDEIYSIDFEGRPPAEPGKGVSALYFLVGPDYFETMGIPLLKGRRFADTDRAGAPRVAIVNDAFVKMHFPDQNPIGQRIRMGRNSSIVREIVGVVGNVKLYALTDVDAAEMYEPFAQMPASNMTFVVKTTGEPNTIAAAVRKSIQQVDPEQPVATINTLEQILSDSTALARVQATLMGSLGAIALLLAAVGLYGVLAYSVSQRTHEIGIRMTLGAYRGQVLLMVLRQALALTAVGLIIGLAGALLLGQALTTVLEPMLFQVRPIDGVTLTIVSVTLAAVTVMAALLPARRATRIDPIQALRSL